MKKALLLYIPVLHLGYIKLIQRHNPVDVLLLSLNVIKEIDTTIAGQLERDMLLRATPLEMIQESLINKFHRPIIILNSLDKLKEYDQIIMPDEDISHVIKQKFENKEIIFDSWFQRWDWRSTMLPKVITGDFVITKEAFHQEMIRKAKQIATKSSDFWRQVGAAVPLENGEILLAFNEHMPTSMEPYINGDMRIIMKPGQDPHICGAIHAELAIITFAASNGIALKNTSIYVTTYPCSGCAQAIKAVGFKQVFFFEGYSNQHAAEILRSGDIETIRVEF